nr:immunoglobulin light chain junction region [Macaca mulatta]MOW13635.1 immunoglobulin light chain junction region [Macaca mulatta]MOW14569.1 immunoglobulin light chain junction region [Macaca mulatta]
CLQNSYSPYSF